MIITAISDIHGNLVDIPKCDVLCICGDIVGLNDQRSMDASKHWFENRFVNWINKLPCDKVLVIPGNHDFYLEKCHMNYDNFNSALLRDIELKTNDKLKFLIDKTFIYEGVNFYGTPWINPVSSRSYWAFQMDYAMEGPYQFENIPDNTDVLLSHDNPYNNETLSKYSKNIKYHFYGHWHEGVTSEKRNRYNCSLLNDNYYLKYKPVIIDIMTDKEKTDLLNKIISMIKEDTDFDAVQHEVTSTKASDFTSGHPLEPRYNTLEEVLEIINSFIPKSTIDKEDEISWGNVITADTTIKEQLNDDNNESD